jgi:hypothetical protein
MAAGPDAIRDSSAVSPQLNDGPAGAPGLPPEVAPGIELDLHAFPRPLPDVALHGQSRAITIAVTDAFFD